MEARRCYRSISTKARTGARRTGSQFSHYQAGRGCKAHRSRVSRLAPTIRTGLGPGSHIKADKRHECSSWAGIASRRPAFKTQQYTGASQARLEGSGRRGPRKSIRLALDAAASRILETVSQVSRILTGF